MFNKSEKDDNMITKFYDKDYTKTEAFTLLWELRDRIHYKKTCRDDLKTVIELLQSAINEIKDTE
jgi:hypothetical protein